MVLGRVNPYTEDTHFSLTAHVCFADFAGFLGFFIRIQQDATAYVFRLDLTEATDQVAIQSLGAGTVVLGTMALFGESEGLFNTVKIVIDVANLEYVSVTINGVAFDLAGDTPLEEGGAGIESIETFLLWSGSDDNAQSLYVDNLSIAHNDT